MIWVQPLVIIKNCIPMAGFAFSFYCFEAATSEENPLEFLLKSLNRAVGDVAYDENGKSKIGKCYKHY